MFQLVDLPLSNLTHSGISDVWLSVQFEGGTLEEQVANGRPWGLDRSRGGLRLLPEEGTGTLDEEGFVRGNADELFRIRDEVASFAPDVVDSLVSSPGATVAGVVRRSVLGPGVMVEPGAEAGVGEAGVGEAGVAGTEDSDVVTLVGRGSTVGKGVSLEAGSRLEPGSSA